MKICGRCDESFTPRRLNQKYCRKDCKRSQIGLANTEARDLKRADWTATPQTFIGVDGEGFKRPAFIKLVDIDDQDELNEINDLIMSGDLEIEHEEDPNTGVTYAGFWEDDAYHAYEMLTVGDQTLGKRGHELTAEEILEFLYGHFEDHAEEKLVYVGFFLGYDFTMWLRHLYWKHAHKLLTKEGIASRTRYTFDEDGRMIRSWKFPVTLWKSDGGADFEIEMLGNKRFSIRRWVPYESRPVVETIVEEDGTVRERRAPHPHKWMNICDAGPFFATSFLNAVNPAKSSEPVLTADEYAILERGKANRDKADFDEDTVEYNVLENEVLKRLMNQLAGGLRSIGIELRNGQWYGPGAAAQKTMDMWGIMTRSELSELMPDEFEIAARSSYYGGWFEIFMLGMYPELVHEYDINSAYPKVIETLPCMCSMAYESGTGKPPTDERANSYVIVDVQTYKHRNPHDRPQFGGLSHRNIDGSILRPLETRGLHFLHEVQAAKRAGCFERLRWYKWWRFTQGCDHSPPFAKIRKMYQERLRVGKNTPRGIAYKLVYNSMYGKLAQSIGMPKYANPLYASLITAGCRTMILDAVSKLPTKSHDVLMIATDGIYTRVPFPENSLEIDPEKLGAWDHSSHEGFTVIMPGVYYSDKTRDDIAKARAEAGVGPADYSSIKIKARGVSARDIGGSVLHFDANFIDMLENPEDWLDEDGFIRRDSFPKVQVKVDFSLTSPKLALARGKWSTCGTVSPTIREISTQPYTKRAGVVYDETPGGFLYLRSLPYHRAEELKTKFYMSMFGSQVAMDRSIFIEDFDDALTQHGEVMGHIGVTLGRNL